MKSVVHVGAEHPHLIAIHQLPEWIVSDVRIVHVTRIGIERRTRAQIRAGSGSAQTTGNRANNGADQTTNSAENRPDRAASRCASGSSRSCSGADRQSLRSRCRFHLSPEVSLRLAMQRAPRELRLRRYVHNGWSIV